MPKSIPAAFPNAAMNLANDQIIDKNTSEISLKKISSPKHYLCICPLCDTVGLDWIIEQYTNYNNILIEDRNSQLIYDPFGRDLIK